MITDVHTEAREASFNDFAFSKNVHRAVAEQGWNSPTPIQALALPELLDGNDVVGLAQTGSGKTAAFSIPMIEGVDRKARGVQALVLVPTRELASQAATEISALSRHDKVRPLVLCGGTNIGPQIKALKNPHQRGCRRDSGTNTGPSAARNAKARRRTIPGIG